MQIQNILVIYIHTADCKMVLFCQKGRRICFGSNSQIPTPLKTRVMCTLRWVIWQYIYIYIMLRQHKLDWSKIFSYRLNHRSSIYLGVKAFVGKAANQWATLFYDNIGFSYDFYINMMKYFNLSSIWFATLARQQTSLSDYFIHNNVSIDFPDNIQYNNIYQRCTVKWHTAW